MIRRHHEDLQTRREAFAAAKRPSSIDEATRSVDVTMATERMVAVNDGHRVIDEVLRMDGAELPSSLPLQADHSRTVLDTMGTVTGLRVSGGDLEGRAQFASDPQSDRVYRRVAEGHLRHVSIGYRILEAVELLPHETRTVNGRMYTASRAPLRIVTRWKPRELSFVLTPADDAAGVRSNSFRGTEMVRTVSEPADRLPDAIADMIDRGGNSLKWADVCARSLDYLEKPVGDDVAEVCRSAFSTPGITSAIASTFGARAVQTFDSRPDSTLGWTVETPVENFISTSLFATDAATRLDLLPRGDVAKHANPGLVAGTIKIARYAKQFVIDEQNILDDQNVGSHLIAFDALIAAAANVRADLVYSLILRNSALLRDSVALFHATHGNLGTGAFTSDNLKIAVAAIGNQVDSDDRGDVVHLNLSAKVIVLPPNLVLTARQTARLQILGDGNDLEVRQESRLGAAGLVDPTADEVLAGTATNWLLCAADRARPAIVVGGLNGSLRPKLRQFQLTGGGQWGMGWDIALDIAAAAVDYAAVYFSTGAA